MQTAVKGKAKYKPQSKRLKNLAIISGIVTLLGIIIYPTFKPVNNYPSATITQPHQSNLSPEKQWFNNIKSNCNSLEVITAMARANYPQTPQGIGYAASCYALAGRIDLAEKVIEELPPNLRVYAAEVVFNIGHPVADSGDDKSAGKIMDLVLKYWSENYMALYHAGMSAYVLGEYAKAEHHLAEFLRIYRNNDGWTNKAKLALSRIENNIPADRTFSIHH